jgi:hypothetical protein
MRFDTHLHVWWPGDGASVRIRTTLPDLDRDFSFERMRSTLLATRVSRVILVAAAQQEDQNARLVEIAKKNPDLVAGVIGWLDVEEIALRLLETHAAVDPLTLRFTALRSSGSSRTYSRNPVGLPMSRSRSDWIGSFVFVQRLGLNRRPRGLRPWHWPRTHD